MQTANYRLSVFYGEPPFPIREDRLIKLKIENVKWKIAVVKTVCLNTKHIMPERSICSFFYKPSRKGGYYPPALMNLFVQ